MLEKMKNRRSIRKFKSDMIPKEMIEKLTLHRLKKEILFKI